MLNLARRSFICENLVSDRREFWNRIKNFSLRPTKGESTPPDDLENRADAFNEHFASVGPRIAAEAASAARDCVICEPTGPRPYRVCASALELRPATLTKLSAAISRLRGSKAVGIDVIPLHAVKKCLPVTAPHLLHLINRSIASRSFPNAWKIARVTPVYKSGDRADLNNYRPISILSVLSKITEKVVCIQLTSYLLEHHILTPTQYAYRPGHSTEDALLDAWVGLVPLG